VAGLPRVAANVSLVKGWFHDTLPRFLSGDPRPFRFIHLDADLYSSTRDVLEAVRGRLVPGTVIIFDELLNVVDWEKNEYRALKERLIDGGVPFTYLAFHSEATLGSGSAVAIRIDAAA
jgi:predicted O-methyltransferase YrrM